MNWNLNIDFPGAVLIVILLLMLWVLWRAHKAKNGLDFAQMLQDDEGKASSSRLAMFVSLAISSWAMMYILVTKKGDIDTWLLLGYIGIWSGAKVAERGLDAYMASKTGANPTSRPPPRPPPPPPITEEIEDETTVAVTSTSTSSKRKVS